MELRDTPSFRVREKDGALVLRRRSPPVTAQLRILAMIVMALGVPALATGTVKGATMMLVLGGIVIALTTLALGEQRATQKIIVRPKRQLLAGPGREAGAGYRGDAGLALSVDGRRWKGAQIERVLVVQRLINHRTLYAPTVLVDDAVVQVDLFGKPAPARALAQALATALGPKNPTVAFMVEPTFAGGLGRFMVATMAVVFDLGAFLLVPLIVLGRLVEGGLWQPAAKAGACSVAVVLVIDQLCALVVRAAKRRAGPDYLAHVRKGAEGSGEMDALRPGE